MSVILEFTLNHKRVVVGKDIDIQVEADDTEVITNVRTPLDGFDLTDDTVCPRFYPGSDG